MACAFLSETVAICYLTKSGQIRKAISIYRWFLPLLELDISTKLVQNIKLAEVETGIDKENVRETRLLLAGEERKRVLGIIRAAIKKRPTLSEYKIYRLFG